MENKIDMNIKLKDNAMIKNRPELWNEWDFKKNDELGLDIYKLSKDSHKKAWWICVDCGSSYDVVIRLKYNNAKCSYCSGKKVNHTNSLASQRPDLTSQLHPTKNLDFNPSNFSIKSGKKVWWLGTCGHEWEANINDRNKGQDCPYCRNKNPKLLKGFNDMWTTNPKLASLLADPEEGYTHGQFSNKRVDWRCKCG